MRADHWREARDEPSRLHTCRDLPHELHQRKAPACRYVGRCLGLPKGYWVGVHFDEPVGKNDGSVKGQRFFDCPDGYGSLLRPDKVRAGNYPEVDEFQFSDGDEI